MPASDEWCRVCVHAGAGAADLTLPARVPVAALIPSIVDILHGPAGAAEATSYLLSPVGRTALPGPTTLAQNGIRDGTVLVLGQRAPAAPVTRHDDLAEAVSAALGPEGRLDGRHAARTAGAISAAGLAGIGALALVQNTFSGNGSAGHTGTTAVAAAAGVVAVLAGALARRVYRDPAAALALGVTGTVFAAIAGFLAVPGDPGLPGVLLAASTAGVTSVLSMRASACGAVTFIAMAGAATVMGAAAFVGVLTAAPPAAVGAVTALASLGLLDASGRMSLLLAGLSPRLDAVVPESDRVGAAAVRADRWLTGLVGAFSSSAAVGAVVTALASGPTLARLVFATVAGALLLSRVHTAVGGRALPLATAGFVTLTTVVGKVAISATGQRPWIAAAAVLLAAAAALSLRFAAPELSLSPPLRRGLGMLERLAVVAMAPMGCWICGVYGAVRGIHVP
ncbi:type VII secretion integral membrane protein EccD [Mycobacterium sp. THU-M116]